VWNIFGRGFDSRRLHQNFINNIKYLAKYFKIQISPSKFFLKFLFKTQIVIWLQNSGISMPWWVSGRSFYSQKSDYKIVNFFDAGPLEHADSEESSVEEGVGPLKV
jgi:hypothetical protein